MKIIEKIQEKQKDLYARKPITFAFLGDSVTQGCFDCYETSPSTIETEFVAEWGYSEVFKKMLHKLYPSVPLAVINAGISGGGTSGGLKRLERDVLSYSPDLVVVCFGLNDCGNGKGGVKDYSANLNAIFAKIKESGAECVFMTPNTMNENISPKLTSKHMRNLAKDFAERMKKGVLDDYVAAAKRVAAENQVPVCDCYALWKTMSANGVNVTELLANKLNHPDKDMHFLFAYELLKTMMG